MSNWWARCFNADRVLDWLKEYIAESRRLTTISLETLLGAREYRAHVHQVASALFDTLSNTQSSGDDVSRSAVTLFSQLVVSSYRRFMTYDERVPLDEKFQKCLVNRALDIEAFPSQRELLYTLTSGSSLIQTLRTMLIYMDADIQRLKTIATITSNACTQRYARETLCPICVTPSSAVDPISQAAGVNESLCPKACRQVIRTCFNQTSNPYVAFASIAKGYSIVAKDIERAILQLKVKIVECTREEGQSLQCAFSRSSLLNVSRNCTSTSTTWLSTRATLGTLTLNFKRLVHTPMANLSRRSFLSLRSLVNDANWSRTGTDPCSSFSLNYNHRSTISISD